MSLLLLLVVVACLASHLYLVKRCLDNRKLLLPRSSLLLRLLRLQLHLSLLLLQLRLSLLMQALLLHHHVSLSLGAILQREQVVKHLPLPLLLLLLLLAVLVPSRVTQLAAVAKAAT